MSRERYSADRDQRPGLLRVVPAAGEAVMTPEQIEARRRGGRTRAAQFTADSQRQARASVKRESLVRAGQRGARTTIERYGIERLVELSRQRRLEKPSAPEAALIDLLLDLGETAGLTYEREYYPLGPAALLTVDFAWAAERKAVEVFGEVHSLFGDPGADSARLARLRAAGWSVLVVEAADLDNPELPIRLAGFLNKESAQLRLAGVK